jgi:hypothetical protein
MSFDDDDGGADRSSRSHIDFGCVEAWGRDFDPDDPLEAGALKSARPQSSSASSIGGEVVFPVIGSVGFDGGTIPNPQSSSPSKLSGFDDTIDGFTAAAVEEFASESSPAHVPDKAWVFSKCCFLRSSSFCLSACAARSAIVMRELFDAPNDPLSSPLKASPPSALRACLGIVDFCCAVVLGVMERELDVEEPVDESSAKTSCCGRLLIVFVVDGVPSFCGGGLEGAEELQRSANESGITMLHVM